MFPSPASVKVPAFRKSGPSKVVCKSDSRRRMRNIYRRARKGASRRQRRFLKRQYRSHRRTLKRCRFRHIQSAINAARSGHRILIMPGIYREEPSRRVPTGAFGREPCKNDYVETEGFSNTAPPPAGPRSNDPPVRPDRNYTIKCPNSNNLIAVVSDPRPEGTPATPGLPRCIRLCNLQIRGVARKPTDVVIVGDRKKLDVIRFDRSTGVHISNLTVEQAAFNGVDLVEVDGFVVDNVVARYNSHYGVLAFTSTHGLFDRIEAFGNGDSGVYPGSNAKGCDYIDRNRYGLCDRATATNSRAGCGPNTTVLRRINSHHNVLGYSGTAGNSTHIHDSEFHHNSSGISTDSFASGHPGMPQECVQWERNRIYSNNNNLFTAEIQQKCTRTPFAARPRTMVCPQFLTPVGTGVQIFGGNRNLVRDNAIYDNWRQGALLIWIPASLRGENDESRQQDTSNGNRFVDNRMGMRPDGTADPNGVDFFWDGQGARNCWERNASKSGPSRASSPSSLPACPGSSVQLPANPVQSGPLVPCAAWDPANNPRPVGCNWFDLPPEPN